MGKYSFANRTIQLWNQLPADALGALSCKPSGFRKGSVKRKIRPSDAEVEIIKKK
jgi:hypothetical protein